MEKSWEEADEDWRKDRDERRWSLPAKAPWPLRLPVIRHIRAAYARIQVERHYSCGLGMIGIRTGYDDWVCYAIQRGWC